MSTTINNISFNTSYYIRKLLLQSKEDLTSLVESDDICFTSKADLEKLLYSVYLEEELQTILVKLYQEQNLFVEVIEQLDKLVNQHQTVVNKADQQESNRIKRKILQLLGFKRIIITTQEVVEALTQISLFSKNYLGSTLTINNWQNTRPAADWLIFFQIEQSAKFIIKDKSQQLSLKQLYLIHEWAVAFSEQSSIIIRDFVEIIKEKKLGELPGGVGLLSANSYAAWINKL
ncbi:hypothetical protein ABN584_15290 [Gloeocapsa sp. BRSZ]